jgi:hypothetical protein
MTELIPDEVGTDGMTGAERQMADNIYAAMMRSMIETDRAKQQQEFVVGVSDLGYCSERLRRLLARQVPDDVDMLPAFHGTWLGEGIEQAVGAAYPEAVIQPTVIVSLRGERNTYEIPGHPDIIFPHGVLLDAKSANGLALAGRTGMSDQAKKFQRHCYAYAAWIQGLFDVGLELDDITVGNVWIDRSARERRLLVKTEPFSLDVIREATEWLDEVVYAWQHDEEARKEPAREVCAKTCGFYADCRGLDIQTKGLLTDPEVLAAVDLYREGQQMESKGKKLKAEAKETLTDVEGTTGEYQVYWTSIGPTKVEAFERAGYKTLKIAKVPKP